MTKMLPWWKRWFSRVKPDDSTAAATDALASLMAVGREAAAWTNLDQFIQVVVDEALRVATADVASLYLRQEEKTRRCQAVFRQKGYHWGYIQLDQGQGPIEWVLKHGEALHMDETQPDMAGLVGEDTSVHSLLALPLPAQDGRIIGVLEVRNKAGGKPFSGWDVQVLTAIADQAAAALDNNRLYQDLYHQGAEIATLFAVSRILAASMEPEETWKAIFEAVRRLMPHEAIEVCLYDEQEQILRPVLAGTHERFWQPEKDIYRLGEGFTGWIAQTRQYLRIGDIHQETRLRPKYERHAGVDMRAYLGVPMILGQRLVGTMEIISSTANAFTSHHADLLISVATQAAAAVERMRLFEELSRRLQEARLLFQVSQGIVGTLGLEQVLDMIVRACVAAIPAAQKGALHLLDEGDQELQIRAAVGYSQEVIDTVRLKVGQGHAGQVVQSGKAVIVDDAQRNLRTFRTGMSEVENIRSIVCVPLQVRERTIGVISLDNIERLAAFRQEDVETLSAFAGQAGIAIENARLYEQLHLQVDQLRQLAQQVLASSTEAQIQTRTSAENIAVLEERSRAIGRFVSQVEQFAEQTDLLALNAAIEAARAGEHGLGFAVVAEEVRRLAESSTEAVGEIAALSQQIVDETRKAVQQMDLVRQAVERTTRLAQGKESAAQAITAQPHLPEERI